ncbi:hypothetical protein EIP91_007636 [Steccherinum ochraceum]|uniref:Major facilitator superfamily (MFS) profile domain-containing protein n=1 Tax=Steccherinum ochraceum TaxID=92696 RepID=A0A4R0R6D7_9APHY|nr:hypothetical protein EIP91_007636 [Steccherinum ochraceum]
MTDDQTHIREDSEKHMSAAPTLRAETPVSELPKDAKRPVPEGGAIFADETASEHTHADGSEQEKGNVDVLVVDWDGPDDPANPKNWTFKRKWVVTAIVSCFTFISPVSSSMMAPASETIAAQFHVTSPVITAMMTSMFVLGYAFGPLFLGPLSEIYGRSRVLQLSNLWYAAWNLGCGFAQDKNQLIVFRLMAGLGGSAPLSIGGGVIGDCWRTEERGKAIALYSLAPLLGPSLGPLIGAWITQRTTWRWIFWSTTLFDVLVQVLGLVFLQETYAPTILERKANQIRKNMDLEKSQYRDVRTVFDGEHRKWQNILRKSLIRPLRFFIYEPIIQLLGLYMAFVYGLMYLYLNTIPSVYGGVYHQSTGIAGLHYLAFGIGLTGASQINARFMDKIYIYFRNKNGGKGRPEYRLPGMVPGSILLPIGLLISGWTARASIHWIAPDIGMALVAAGMILSFQCIQNYVIDAFTLHAASALAAVAFLRSVCGFGFPLFAPSMYKALGFGKGDTILAVVGVVFGCPAPFFFWKYGERIRQASRYAS